MPEKMNVTYASPPLRLQASSAVAAGPGQQPHHAQGNLLRLVDTASSLSDLATTASVRLTRLSNDPIACFRYANADAALFFYPIQLNAEPMVTPMTGSLGFVRAVQIAAIR